MSSVWPRCDFEPSLPSALGCGALGCPSCNCLVPAVSWQVKCAGWYQDKRGQFECQSCDFFHAEPHISAESAEGKRFYYQDLVGQASCSLCAKNTRRGPSLALKSSCLCMHGATHRAMCPHTSLLARPDCFRMDPANTECRVLHAERRSRVGVPRV